MAAPSPSCHESSSRPLLRAKLYYRIATIAAAELATRPEARRRSRPFRPERQVEEEGS